MIKVAEKRVKCASTMLKFGKNMVKGGSNMLNVMKKEVRASQNITIGGAQPCL